MDYSRERANILQNFSDKYSLKFKNLDNLNIALIHPSCGEINYERLEFLGDCVLRMVISDYLFKKYKTNDEGFLTKIRAHIVSDNTLAQFAKKIELWDLILKDGIQKKQTKGIETILACSMEAILGAIYLEHREKAYKIVSNFIFSNFKDEIEKIEEEIDMLNPKAKLQEYSQAMFHILPEYVFIKEEGAEHNKIFTYQIKLNDVLYKEASGNSKKEAQKQAAYNALLELKLI